MTVSPPSEAIAFVRASSLFGNLGDALIVRELIRQLAKRLPTRVDVSGCPPDYVSALDLDTLDGSAVMRRGGRGGFLASQLIERLRGRKVYHFLAPGGFSGEAGRRGAPMEILANTLLAIEAAAGVRICQGGVSYDHLGPRRAARLRGRTRHAFSHVVRDGKSFDYAASIGIRVDGVAPDYAFGLFESPPPPADRSAIAFSFRIDKYPQCRADILAHVRSVMQRAGPATFKFVAQVKRDAAFMRELHDAVAATPGAVVEYHVCTSDIAAGRALYADCRAIHSNRLHALLLAMGAGAVPYPAIRHEADAKIVGVFEGLGLMANATMLGGPLAAETTLDLAAAEDHARRLTQYFDSVLEAA